MFLKDDPLDHSNSRDLLDFMLVTLPTGPEPSKDTGSSEICLKKPFRKMLQLRIASGKVGRLSLPPPEHP